jgi:hypothetical protein
LSEPRPWKRVGTEGIVKRRRDETRETESGDEPINEKRNPGERGVMQRQRGEGWSSQVICIEAYIALEEIPAKAIWEAKIIPQFMLARTRRHTLAVVDSSGVDDVHGAQAKLT